MTPEELREAAEPLQKLLQVKGDGNTRVEVTQSCVDVLVNTVTLPAVRIRNG